MTHINPDLSDRLITFAANVIRLTDQLPSTKAGREVAGQIIRSSTSVGANYEEARGADSRADFCNKLQISYKEMRESRYWLCVVVKAGFIADQSATDPLIQEATELRAILAKCVATARGKAKSNGPHPIAPAQI